MRNTQKRRKTANPLNRLMSSTTPESPSRGRGRPRLEKDDRVDKAARNFIAYPKLSLPYHMRGCNFTIEESSNRTIQMRVRRRMWEIIEWGKKKAVVDYIEEREQAMHENGVEFAAESLAQMSNAAAETHGSAAAATPTIEASAQQNDTTAAPTAAALPPQVQQIMDTKYLPTVQPLAVPNAPPKVRKTKKKPKKKGPKIRRTKAQIAQAKAYEAVERQKQANARIAATQRWFEQTQRKAEGLEHIPIEKVLEAVENEFGYVPSAATVYNDVKNGYVGEPPKKRGASAEYLARKKAEKAAAAAAVDTSAEYLEGNAETVTDDIGAFMENV